MLLVLHDAVGPAWCRWSGMMLGSDMILWPYMILWSHMVLWSDMMLWPHRNFPKQLADGVLTLTIRLDHGSLDLKSVV